MLCVRKVVSVHVIMQSIFHMHNKQVHTNSAECPKHLKHAA